MKHITMQEIEKLYPILHEATENKFVDTVDRMISKKNLRTLQQYEIRFVLQ